MENSKRNFVKIISELCISEGIDFELFAGDWIFRLYKNSIYKYIVGYQFDLNPASVHSICCDKSAASEIMHAFGIPHIKHEFFMSPTEPQYMHKNGNWSHLLEMLHHHKELVCKPNEGTGGKLVFKVCNVVELEQAAHKIFNGAKAMAVSPFYEINNEYRIIILDGEVKLIYSKQRPFVIGDGTTTLINIITQQINKNDFCTAIDFTLDNISPNLVLNKGQVFYLNWKHNLAHGAKAIIVNDKIIISKLKNIIQNLVDNINLKFASIDIVECNNELKVLEINSGVMMDFFASQSDDYYNIAKEIYKEALRKMFM